MIYNVKTIDYLDSVQVRCYARPIKVSNEIKIPKKMQEKKFSAGSYRTREQLEHSITVSVNRTVNQIYSIARSNHWEYFVTLTADPKKINNKDYILICDKLSIWLNNLRKRYAPNLKYLVVPELHKDREKWHFHALFSDVGNLPFDFSGKVCVGKYVYDYEKKPFATKIYNLPLWKYGYSTATRVRDTSKAASYITKYITKDLSRVLPSQNRYFNSHNCDRPVEHVYNIDYDVLADLVQSHFDYIDYMSNVELKGASQSITYMEFNKK